MKTILAIFLTSISMICFSQDVTQLRKTQFNLDNGIAISGFDPVAYFKQGTAAKGKKELAVFDRGVTYYFSSIETKKSSKRIHPVTNRSTVVGVPMLWERMGQKWKWILKLLKLLMGNYTCTTTNFSTTP